MQETKQQNQYLLRVIELVIMQKTYFNSLDNINDNNSSLNINMYYSSLSGGINSQQLDDMSNSLRKMELL